MSIIYHVVINSNDKEKLDLLDFAKNVKIANNITNVKYFYKKQTKRMLYHNPPIGPIPKGAQCSYDLCSRKGPNNHIHECLTPDTEHLIISDEGYSMYKKEIKNFLIKKEVPEDEIEEILREKEPIKFSSVIPTYMKYNEPLPNFVTLNYKHKGKNVTIRVTSNRQMIFLLVPNDLDYTGIYNRLLGNIQNSDVIMVKKYIQMLKPNWNFIMYKIDDYLQINKNILNYTFNTSSIYFTLKNDQFKVKIIMRKSGKAEVTVTKKNKPDVLNDEVVNYFENVVRNMFQPMIEDISEYIPKIEKIDNIIKPPGYKKKTDLQPQICTGNNRLKPDPFSFNGWCPGLLNTIKDVGNSYSRAGNAFMKKFPNYYEPCCMKITGKVSAKLDAPAKHLQPIPLKFERIKNFTYDDMIKNATGVRKSMIERIVYGYFPDDGGQASTYIPKTKIVEDRSYLGLKQLVEMVGKDNVIESVLKCYYGDSIYVKAPNKYIEKYPRVYFYTGCTEVGETTTYKVPKDSIYCKLYVSNNEFHIVHGNRLILNGYLRSEDKLEIVGFFGNDIFYPLDIKYKGVLYERQQYLNNKTQILFPEMFTFGELNQKNFEKKLRIQTNNSFEKTFIFQYYEGIKNDVIENLVLNIGIVDLEPNVGVTTDLVGTELEYIPASIITRWREFLSKVDKGKRYLLSIDVQIKRNKNTKEFKSFSLLGKTTEKDPMAKNIADLLFCKEVPEDI